jgi:hypothetical protein
LIGLMAEWLLFRCKGLIYLQGFDSSNPPFNLFFILRRREFLLYYIGCHFSKEAENISCYESNLVFLGRFQNERLYCR